MNEQNYCSLSASKKLVEADIILKTDVFWIKVSNNPWMLSEYTHGAYGWYPAPSFAELWRELPETMEDYELNLQKAGGGKLTSAAYCRADHAIYQCTQKGYYATTNPADALAELLIWVRGEKI